ncbi:hypothetical protein [Mycobacteroides abscessus]|uniref:hypothetical protein n=1 Tax=Mycobacteroides abscessus TaxID=36809 RepID=UPI0012FFDD97|nr:hypothetical protein [Mycobacteroides abscessus]
MSSKQVVPVAPGIFIDGNPVVAIVWDAGEGASFADAAPLVVNEGGGISEYKPGGEKLRTYTGSWS